MQQLAKDYIEFNEKTKESKEELKSKICTIVKCDMQFDVEIEDARIEVRLFNSPDDHIIIIDYSLPLNMWSLMRVTAKGVDTQKVVSIAQSIVDKLNGKE